MTTEAQKAYQRQWYQANKEKHKAATATRKARMIELAREHIQTLKNKTPCTDCGVQYPYYVMDFDHQGDKEYTIANMVHQGYGVDKIQLEIDKCEIVCSNCHRIRTHSR